MNKKYKRLISKGSIRSVFTSTYSGWNVGEKSYTLKNRVTVWAGKYRHANRIYAQSSRSSDALVPGPANRDNDKPPIRNVTEEEYFKKLYKMRCTD